MGLDLLLLPFDADFSDLSFSHTILNCERRRDLFDAIQQTLRETPVPEHFRSYVSQADGRDSHYGITTETPYGESLGWVYAGDLRTFSEHPDVLDNERNRAIWAYLAQLPFRTKVALYWH